jgi:hypothetical protein
MKDNLAELRDRFSADSVVKLTRPDGSVKYVRVDGEQLDRLMDVANGQFGDPSVDLGGPALPKKQGK